MATTIHRRNHHLATTATSAFPSTPTTMEPFNKFNSALNQGLLNPMSPPPPSPPPAKPRSSPTLFEMMANEPELIGGVASPQNPQIVQNQTLPAQLQDSKQSLLNRRLEEILAARSPGNLFDDSDSGDVKLTLSSKDGVSVCLNVHARVLVENSRFFALKLNENNLGGFNGGVISVEIADCEDVEVYVETLRLMYCRDLRRKLVKEDVCKVLGVLKVSAAIGFDAGVLYCLEYLEAAPWTEEEEDKVASLLSELQLEGVGPREVLKRVSPEITSNNLRHSSENEEILLKLLHVVLHGKDEKARREMKALVTKMLRESNSNPSSSSHNDFTKESLYSSCNKCLASLRSHFIKAAESDLSNVAQISRQADNLQWLLDLLIDRQSAEDFLGTWASSKDLSEAHCKVPAIHRYEISRVTARFFVGIGKGQILASKEARIMLLNTWLVPFYEDFGWLRRASKGNLDRHVIEEGLCNTVLTLPMALQQKILMSWFDRFVDAGEDCPNLRRGFEVWWRRAFLRRRNGGVEGPTQRVRAAVNGDAEK